MTRTRKDGTPIKPYILKNNKKPISNCKHVWRLRDLSAVVTCDRCEGQVFPATPNHTAAYLEARMKSNRGTEAQGYAVGRKPNG